MFTLSIMSAVQDALRTTMLDICSVIYRLIAFCFEVFYNLGTANLLQNEAAQNIISRTTLIIGLFMVFRVTFAFIQYIIDPDAMTDKSKGAGAIVKKIVIAIVLLGSTSFLFRFAFKVQDTVLDSHVLEKVFFGNNEIDTESFGGRLSSTIFTTFYRIKPNPSNSANKNYSDCKDLVENYLEEDIANNKGSVSLAYSCLLKRADFPAENDLAEEIASNGEKEDKTSYVINFDGGGVLALLVGVAVLYVGFMFTFQVGVRLLQLAYLQIIAPIPIAMYITPKGEENLKKWGQQCLVTFLDFFLRVAIIYFAICIIEIIRDNNTILSIYGEGTIYNTYVTCVMIIATLLFAKKIPNLLKEIFPGLGGAAGFSYDISGKAFKETMKLGYNATPIGWGLKGAKSLGSAIDRKVHGKSFFGSGKIMQAIDKWLPEQAEIRKNRHEQDDRRKLYDEGRNIYNEFNGEIKDENGKLKPKVFKNEAFKKSWQEVADAKSIQKRYDAELADAQAKLSRGEITTESAIYKNAIGNAKAAAGRLEAAKKDHENNRKIYFNDARIEDAFNYYHDMQFEVSNSTGTRNLTETTANNQQNNNQHSSNIIVEEHAGSRPRQEANAGPSPQEEYSRLVNQYNSETDPNRKAEIKRQLDEFESGKRG